MIIDGGQQLIFGKTLQAVEDCAEVNERILILARVQSAEFESGEGYIIYNSKTNCAKAVDSTFVNLGAYPPYVLPFIRTLSKKKAFQMEAEATKLLIKIDQMVPESVERKVLKYFHVYHHPISRVALECGITSREVKKINEKWTYLISDDTKKNND